MTMTDLFARDAFDRRRAMQLMAAAGVMPVVAGGLARTAEAAADLVVFDWTGYEIPELHEEYIEKYGASPEVAVYADVHEAFNKIQAGYRCDTVHPNIWDVRRFYDAGLLQPWDTSRLVYWNDVFPQFPAMAGAQYDGEQYLIPTDWGINALIVRTDVIDVDAIDPSWSLLWDDQYAGHISMNAEMESAVKTAALVLGIEDPYHATDEEVEAIRQKLTEQRELVRYYWSDPTELEQSIAAGEVVAAWAWPQVYGDLVKEGQPVAYLTPKEGVNSWVTGFVRLAEAPGKEQNAYDYVDAWLAPETGKWLIENYGYGHTNRNSFTLVSAEVLDEKGLADPEAMIAGARASSEFEPELNDRLINMYEEVKAGY
jgi:spermidine/putrescine-binding protein